MTEIDRRTLLRWGGLALAAPFATATGLTVTESLNSDDQRMSDANQHNSSSSRNTAAIASGATFACITHSVMTVSGADQPTAISCATGTGFIVGSGTGFVLQII
jgi:hypothetical protein